MIRRWLTKSPNYVKRFGVFRGLGLMFRVERELPIKSNATRYYRVPGVPSAIALRESRPDHAIFWQCLVRNQYDTDGFPQSVRLNQIYAAILDSGRRPVIVDCGANIGLATVWYAMRYPRATIYAIEPDARNYDLLEQNTKAFGPRVVPLRGGVWNRSCHLRISNPKAGSTAFQVEECEQAGEDTLRAYTIQEVLDMAGPQGVPLVVKVDIEGAQKQLFSDNTDWVAHTPLIAIELDDWLMPWQGTSRPLFACLSRYRFDYLMQGETLFCFQDMERQ